MRSLGKMIDNSALFGAARSAVIYLLLLAFVVQVCVVSAHFHAPSYVASGVAKDLGRKDGSPLPSQHDDAPCLLCQHAVLVGTFVASSPATLPLPVVVCDAAAPTEALQSYGGLRIRSWQSRAPPTV